MSNTESSALPEITESKRDRKVSINTALTYEHARADERKVLTRKFVRWLELASTQRMTHEKRIETVSSGMWLAELNEHDLTDKDPRNGARLHPKAERRTWRR